MYAKANRVALQGFPVECVEKALTCSSKALQDATLVLGKDYQARSLSKSFSGLSHLLIFMLTISVKVKSYIQIVARWGFKGFIRVWPTIKNQ